MDAQQYTRVTDLNHPPIIGEYYYVPCLLNKIEESNSRRYIPVLLPVHQDINNSVKTKPHYHIDTRFINNRFRHFKSGNFAVIADKFNELIWRIMKCYRIIHHMEPIGFEEKYKNSCIKNWKCPHQGFDLRSIPIKNGCVTCPMHGLTFNIKDGRLMNPIRTLVSDQNGESWEYNYE